MPLLSLQVALLQKIYDDLKPRAMTAEQLLQQPRPMLAQVEDVELPWKAKKKDGSVEGGSDGSSSVPTSGNTTTTTSSSSRPPSSSGTSSNDEAGSAGAPGPGAAGQLQG